MNNSNFKSKLESQEFLIYLKERLSPFIKPDSPIYNAREQIPSLEVGDYLSIGDREVPEKPFYKMSGVVAGGAVANIALEYLSGLPAKINDVDWFFYHFTADSREELQDMEGELYLSSGRDAQFYYNIVESKQYDKENRIKIEIAHTFEWINLLESFDFNCCQIMLDWESGKVLFTKGFLEFLTSRVILKARGFDASNPLTSLLRAKQKEMEMNSKLYFQELLIDHLVKPWVGHLYEENFQGIRVSSSRLSIDGDTIITKKRLRELKKNKNILMPFFSLKGKSLVFNRDNDFAWNHFFNQISNIKVSSVERESGFHRSFFVMDELIKNQKVLTKIFKESKSNLENLGTLLKTESFHIETAFKLFLEEKLFQIKKEDLRLLKKMHTHDGIYFASSIILNNKKLKWSLQDYFNLLRELKREPLDLYGVFEGVVGDLNFLEGRRPAQKAISKDFFKKDFKAIIDKLHIILEEQTKQNKLKDSENIKPFSKWVLEITDSIRLREEGRVMRHCVGGYGYQVKKGQVMIFHIKTKKGESTFEALIKGKKLTRGQHKSKCNTNPPETNKKIAQRLLNYLNFYNS